MLCEICMTPAQVSAGGVQPGQQGAVKYVCLVWTHKH